MPLPFVGRWSRQSPVRRPRVTSRMVEAGGRHNQNAPGPKGLDYSSRGRAVVPLIVSCQCAVARRVVAP